MQIKYKDPLVQPSGSSNVRFPQIDL
jgi:hypothetical protein